jgi:hypothetical protein
VLVLRGRGLRLRRQRRLHVDDERLHVQLHVGRVVQRCVRSVVQLAVQLAEQLHDHVGRQREPHLLEPVDLHGDGGRVGERAVRFGEPVHRAGRRRFDLHLRIERKLRGDLYGDVLGGELRRNDDRAVRGRFVSASRGRFTSVQVIERARRAPPPPRLP